MRHPWKEINTLQAVVRRDDTKTEMEYIVRKLLGLRYHQAFWIWFILFGRLHSTTELVPRLWEDEGGRRWAKSAKDLDLEMLCVSQFTLYHVMKVLISTSSVTSLNFISTGQQAWLPPGHGGEESKLLYDQLLSGLKKGYKEDKIQNGVFGAMMQVAVLSRPLFGVKL